MRAFALCCVALIAAQPFPLEAQGEGPRPLQLLDVPFISQSELLCGGAAAAMVLRFWGERGVSAEAFAHLVDRSAAGIRTDALVDELTKRGWTVQAVGGEQTLLRDQISRGRPVLALIEERPSAFHYVVVVAWHGQGVVLHDPARGPFVVMSAGEFERRWRASRRWMAVVVPGRTGAAEENASALPPAPVRVSIPENACEQAVAQGVRHAQSNELDEAERILAAAVGCPAAARELAGLRVLQKRWIEAEDLASAAVTADERDDYAWKVLATSRFVQNDRLGALSAWNRVGEPRLDLVQIDGLTRTRHRVVERLLDAPTGDVLTVDGFARARRQLASLPAAASTRLDYVPVAGGLAELRAFVAERPLVPKGRLSLVATGLVAAATRELRITTGAISGGGEEVSGSWRFWPGRVRVAGAVHAPAPWGGVWGIDVFAERQSFSAPELPSADRRGASVAVSDWLTGRVRWTASAGVDAWSPRGARARAGGGIQVTTFADRLDVIIDAAGWPGSDTFGTFAAGVRARSSTARQGVVLLGTADLQLATRLTPLDLWWAGDTGHARPALLRAHPALDGGRLRTARLGRTLGIVSVEAQRWWTVSGPLRAAAAMFGDVAHTAQRYEGRPLRDVDVGIGVRLAVAGVPGVFNANLAKGLADGATAFSVTYQP